jgi:hypothetical protein
LLGVSCFAEGLIALQLTTRFTSFTNNLIFHVFNQHFIKTIKSFVT